MNAYIKKVSKTLLFGLAILVICLLIYMFYPKYQINTVRVDDNQVLITKINTLTGQTYLETKTFKRTRFSEP